MSSVERGHRDGRRGVAGPGGARVADGGVLGLPRALVHFGAVVSYIQVSPYFDPTYTRTGWIGQPPVLDRYEVVTIDGDVATLRHATP